jgi:WD40 repeat protein
MFALTSRRQFRVMPGGVDSIQFVSPTRLAVSSQYHSPNLDYLGGGVRLVSLRGRVLARAFTGWGGGKIAVRPDGREAACTGRRSCLIRSLRSRRLPVVRQLVLGDDRPYALTYSPDGRWLVWGGGESHPLIRWDVSDWSPTPLTGFKQPVSCLAISPDRGHLLIGGWEGGIQVWDLARWEVVAAWQSPPRPAGAGIGTPAVQALQLSPDGSTLFAALSGQPFLRVFAMQEFASGSTFDQQARVHAAILLPGGRLLATGDEAGEVKLWDVTTRTVVARYRTPPGEQRTLGIGTGVPGRQQVAVAEVSSLAVSPDGKMLAAGDFLGRVHLIRLDSAELDPRAGDPRTI